MADDIQSKAAEVMKKVLTIGVGTVFLTEESLRGLMSEFKLPKELLSSVLESANKTKNEFLHSLGQEIVSRVLERVDVKELVQEVLEKHEIDLHIQLKFNPRKKVNK